MTATCPKGHASDTADYCDVCGTPIEPASSSPSASGAEAPPSGPGAVATEGWTCPTCATENPGGHRFCENCGADMTLPSTAPSGGDPGAAGVTAGWEVVATADRELYDRIEKPEVVFPVAAPVRRFSLCERAAIGRRSASRGIVPEIDLSAAPEDAGVSHHHAVLMEQPDGSWAIVDSGSANGTFLNDQTDPLAVNELVPLVEGDRIHVGAWTTLTLRRL